MLDGQNMMPEPHGVSPDQRSPAVLTEDLACGPGAPGAIVEVDARADLQARIEAFLLAVGSWVRVETIAWHFGITPRQLRQNYEVPGLVSSFAISGDAGLKHVARATTAEWLHFKHRIRRHAIAELVRVRTLSHRRAALTRGIGPRGLYEVDSSQLLLATVAARGCTESPGRRAPTEALVAPAPGPRGEVAGGPGAA